MTPTTTEALSTAFIAAIHAITPRFAHERSTRWKHTPSGYARGGPESLRGSELRSFDLKFDPGVPGAMLKGASGEDYTARLRVAVSYSRIDPELLGHMITADAVDLRRVLMALTEPTVDGLIQVHHEGPGLSVVDDQANAVVEQIFRVNWLQNTDAL